MRLRKSVALKCVKTITGRFGVNQELLKGNKYETKIYDGLWVYTCNEENNWKWYPEDCFNMSPYLRKEKLKRVLK
jgi:hypothetical protein